MNCQPLRHVLVCAVASATVWVQQAHAQVLDQIPADAVAVVKIKSLDQTSTKVAKMAADWGLDQMVPDLKDPLGSLLEKGQMTAGVDKSGDAAIAFFDPAGGPPDEAMVALVPVSDYKAFVGNFKDGVATGEITKAKAPDESAKEVYLAHWGKYAALSPTQSLISKKPAGLKLAGLSAKESEKRDVILYSNVAAWRSKAITQLEAGRKKAADQISSRLVDEQQKKFAPIAQLMATKYIDAVEEFVNDTTSTLVGVDLGDEGISTTALAEFKPDSTLGTYAKRLQNNGAAKLLAGLPMRKYFFFGGAKFDPKVMTDIYNQAIVPMSKELAAQGDDGKKMADMLTANSAQVGKISGMTFGMVVPTGALGQESVLQTVALLHGDAASLFATQRESIKKLGDTLKAGGAAGAPTLDFDYTENAKTVGGVALDSYSMNIKADANDPKAAQAQQIIGMLTGPSGLGGSFGVATPDTMVIASGATDKLLSELITAAKNPQDNLSTIKGVQMVSGHLAANRNFEFYAQLDNVVMSAVKYAAGFGFPVKVKLPPNLPPIGVSGSTDGSAVRIDSFLPSSLVQSMIAAGIEAYANFQGGGNGAGGPGGL